MKKTLMIIFLVFAFTFSILGQVNYSEEYGKVTQYEMDMTQYESDEEAEAVVIYEIGDNFFRGDEMNGGFVLHMRKRTKIKILNKAGLKYANIEIPYYKEGSQSESIDNLNATVYNRENGVLNKTPLNPKNVFEEKINDNVFVKKIALSDVKVGSVIEYKYDVITPYFFHMRKWEFQKQIPVIHSKLIYRAIPYYVYSFILKGSNEFDVYDSKVDNTEIGFGRLHYKEMVYNFEKINLKAFRDDDFISSPQNYLIALDFQVSRINYPSGGFKDYISTWPTMSDDFLKNDDFGKYIKASEKEGKKIYPILGLEGKTPLEQAQAITNYVKKMYTWNGYQRRFTESKLSDFLKQKTGNSANINLFLIGFLRSANIEVYPIVLSTRDNGIISKGFPFQQFLNYVIAEIVIDDKKYFVDATEPLLSFGELPERCIYSDGLVIKPKSEEWAFTEPLSNDNTIEKIFEIVLMPETNSQNVDVKYITNGQSAYDFRKIYSEDVENLKTYLRKRHNIILQEELVVDNKENAPFCFSFNSNISLENSNNKLFVHPFSNISISENPFKKTSRTLPIDLVYIRGEKYLSTIKIPKGYSLEYLPKDVKHDSKVMSIRYSAKVVDGVIVIEASYSLYSNIYQASDYGRLKNTFSEMIKIFSDMIVLSKSSI